MLQTMTMVMHRQTSWMRNNAQVLETMRSEILQPCVQFLADSGNRKRRRSTIKPINTDWKGRSDIVIQMADKSQHELKALRREQIVELVLLYQNTKQWPEPVILFIYANNNS
jgi:hypothetical protein